MRHVLAAVLIVSMWPCAVPAQAPLEFEVASIKRDTSDRPMLGRAAGQPAGQITEGLPARFLITRPFPDLTPPLEVIGLPGWADSERYIVSVRFKPEATPQEQTEMWLRLLTDRLKLRAHYETRERPAYALRIARSDGKLGPNLAPSTLNCPVPEPGVRPEPTPPSIMEAMLAATRDHKPPSPEIEAQAMSRCRVALNFGDTMYAGAFPLETLARLLQSSTDRQIVDGTGLTGLYAIKLTYSRRPPPTPGPEDPPSVFTALREQLGLKLESITTKANVLVVDHVERPTEN